VILLCLLERLPGDLDRRIVTLLATEYAAKTTGGLRLELRPLGRGQGDRNLAKIKRRYGNMLPERVEPNARISCER
jgi:hypothetical protein